MMPYDPSPATGSQTDLSVIYLFLNEHRPIDQLCTAMENTNVCLPLQGKGLEPLVYKQPVSYKSFRSAMF